MFIIVKGIHCLIVLLYNSLCPSVRRAQLSVITLDFEEEKKATLWSSTKFSYKFAQWSVSSGAAILQFAHNFFHKHLRDGVKGQKNNLKPPPDNYKATLIKQFLRCLASDLQNLNTLCNTITSPLASRGGRGRSGK